MEALAPVSSGTNGLFKLLLFIDKRPNSTEQVRRIRQHLKKLQEKEQQGEERQQDTTQKSLSQSPSENLRIGLEIIDVSNQPYLAEHFKLVATPALIKVSADKHQVLAGSDIATQLEDWWPRWQKELEDGQKSQLLEGSAEENDSGVTVDAVAQSTEILRLSDEIFRLDQEKEALTSQIAFKDHIIAMMAHDLRNPLTAASIALETLELAYEPNSQRAEKFTPELKAHLIKSTKVQIRTINSMIAEILQAAKGSNAQLQVVPEKLQLQTLCTEVMASFQSKLNHKKQSLDTDIPQDLPYVYADKDQIQRVLTNLIDNAIKYTPANGKISMSALHRTTEKVQISIRDTGPGIPRENQTIIFEESFRLTRDQTKDGYGLGLALCQRIVRAHYGQIWVDSKAGEGSCFHFTMPVYRGSQG
ncbi:MAG: two-component system, OmpR family, clock-associated histidine kinase SasA [Phormidesmis priestleyi Ana]|uniref:Adaptive-response sensory-kinase SasA n=1 Tax=Phormidesmis priestleyi Ana TaxID=1666911 RepID=A0A0N8KN98_9CYAN|nr:MAG: two-component system, OmpR family, clock-associated histidine kinase SasA [Phormidesmis priestleyi Ana]